MTGKLLRTFHNLHQADGYFSSKVQGLFTGITSHRHTHTHEVLATVSLAHTYTNHFNTNNLCTNTEILKVPKCIYTCAYWYVV